MNLKRQGDGNGKNPPSKSAKTAAVDAEGFTVVGGRRIRAKTPRRLLAPMEQYTPEDLPAGEGGSAHTAIEVDARSGDEQKDGNDADA